jgi:purine-binding chemotaxis protein CheW
LAAAAQPAEPPEAQADAPQEHLAFLLEKERYAIPILALREIVKVPPLTEVPRTASHVLGVMNLRGEMLPVFDLKPKLGLGRAPTQGGMADVAALPKLARILVIRDESGDAGLLVDAVQSVVRLRASAIEMPPPGLPVDRDCVVGIGRVKDELFILLDIHQALA